MPIAVIQLDSACACNEEIDKLLHDAQLLHVGGVINRHWNDESAVELATGLNLHDVDWDVVYDDTPGTLELTLLYFNLTSKKIQCRLEGLNGLEGYELDGECYD